jgi:hypothetical protein
LFLFAEAREKFGEPLATAFSEDGLFTSVDERQGMVRLEPDGLGGTLQRAAQVACVTMAARGEPLRALSLAPLPM